MPNKLILKKIVAVALCKQGCNPDADIMLYKSLDKEDKTLKTLEEILKSLSKEDLAVVNAEIEKAKKKAAEDAEDAIDGGMDEAMENPDGSLKNPKKPVAKVAAKLCKMKSDYEALEQKVNKSVDAEEDIWKGINPAVKKMFEDAEKKANAAEAVAKALEEEKVTKQYIDKASVFKAIPSTPEELGSILKSVSIADKDAGEKLEALLKATNELVVKGGVFKEFGSGVEKSVGNAWEEIQAKAKEIIAKSTDKMSHEQAITKIARENPKLYAQYLQELEGDEN